MCGIFGGVIGGSSQLRRGEDLERSVERLFLLSESRGKEAAGLAVTNDASLGVYKAAVSARAMIRDRDYRAFLREAASDGKNGISFIGHSRLVTDGAREVNRNNQPVLANGIVGIHNGIIVNHASLWKQHAQLERQFEVDSEVIFALVRAELDRGATLVAATQATFRELEGAASIAALFDDRDQLLLATNNGSLYYRHAPENGAFVFSSERYIMDRFAEKYAEVLGGHETVHVRANQGVVVDLADLSVEPFALDAHAAASATSNGHHARPHRRVLIDRAPDDSARTVPAPAPPLDLERLNQRFPYRSMLERLRRCTRCVLPETMPFVDFDKDGVCAYCRNYQIIKARGRDELEQVIAPYRSRDGRPDCIVGVSGGRDSMYGLHYLKTVLGLNPIAYTYDWGMVTDLARRNVSRICGKLGIEHILVSADIPKKRANIRKNVEAWLAKPTLGTVPLFMAGDKAYFHFLNKTREQLGVKLSFMCENPLERTYFKTGFAGMPPTDLNKDSGFRMSFRRQLDLVGYYAREIAHNPRYVNSSILDTAKGFAYFYMIPHEYHNLYWYTDWDEATIEATLLGQYGFELAEDTKTTWRIGDGTAPFYNYIYYAISGLTENDTFRSNQIRQGAITRDAALAFIDRDNRPRFPSIQWYLQTIGMERSLEDVIDIIERVPKLYERGTAR